MRHQVSPGLAIGAPPPIPAGIARIVQGIVKAGASDALVAQLQIHEQRQRDLRAQLAQVQSARGAASLDTAKIKREVQELAGDVTSVLRDHLTPPTRMMLRKVLVGKDHRRAHHAGALPGLPPQRARNVRGVPAGRRAGSAQGRGTAGRWWPQRDTHGSRSDADLPDPWQGNSQVVSAAARGSMVLVGRQ